jgi:hypothetical protein
MKSRKTYSKNIPFSMEMSFQLSTSADWYAYLKITSFFQMIKTFTSIKISNKKPMNSTPHIILVSFVILAKLSIYYRFSVNLLIISLGLFL